VGVAALSRPRWITCSRSRVRCDDAVVAVTMDAGRLDEAPQCGEQRKRGERRRRLLEEGEGEDGAAVAGGSCREVDDLVNTGLAV
jgi:hypothetical protein